MTKSKNTKRALIVSALCLLLCVSMLVGTTFAWFTDNASTNVNKIEAGTLEIGLYQQKADGGWLDAEGKTLNFVDADNNKYWEPGCTYKLPNVVIKNKGNLALKFKLTVNGITGKDAALASVIEVYNGEYNAENKDNYLGLLSDLIADTNGAAHGILLPKGATKPDNAPPEMTIGESRQMQLTLHMQESAGNPYQGMKLDGISVTVQATQYTFEKDSNDDQYDANAAYTTLVTTNEEFKNAVAQDEEYINVVLANDITYDIGGIFTVRMGGDNTKAITIDGQGHEIHFNGTNSDWNGIGTKNGAKLVINNATISVKNGLPTGGVYNSHDIYFGCDVELNNVTTKQAVAVDKDAVFNNVTITDTTADADVYFLWITARGQSVTLNNCTINAKSTNGHQHRAIAIKDQNVTSDGSTVQKVNLTVNGGTISSDKKAAILVTSSAGADISLSGLDISGVVADKTNAVWIDSANPNAPVTVTGGTAIVEP